MAEIEPDRFHLESYLELGRARVDACLDEFLPAADTPPLPIHQAVRYSIFAGGKRIRPLLALATMEALDGSRPAQPRPSPPEEAVLRFACAVEMVHTYSLIHDDLPAMDNDDFRRGRLTCHKVYGEGIAVLAGNGLMSLAFEMLSAEWDGAPGAGVRLEVIHRLSRAIGTERGVIGGQVADLTSQGKTFSATDLHYIHSAKTGALIEVSVTGAALLSGASAERLDALSCFGRNIGLAFQITDDILDITGTREEMGKTLGKDVESGKATYPALYGIERSRARAEELVEEAVTSVAHWGTGSRGLIELARFITLRRI